MASRFYIICSNILQIHWLQVGSLADNNVKIIDGYVWQAHFTYIFADILQIHWLQVGSLADNYEKIIDGYVWQADTTGIKAAWAADDHQSGITGFIVAVGTSPG
jgi:hypothetical protein